MTFTDRQTLDDLMVFARNGNISIYNLFNHTKTAGGAKLLHDMFEQPLADAAAISQRSKLIGFFMDKQISFNFREEWFDVVEKYITVLDERSKLPQDRSLFERKFSGLIGSDTGYRDIKGSIEAIAAIIAELELLLILKGFVEEATQLSGILSQLKFDTVDEKTSYEDIVALDNKLRFSQAHLISALLKYLYYFDVLVTVAKVAVNLNFSMPVIVSEGGQMIDIKGLFHPLVSNAVGNDFAVHQSANLVFLTGANMAGKSTFMKSVSIALYLAHMGFPVPASRLCFTVFDGIYTTINLPDNLGLGASHFYAEVLRVKRLALELSKHRKLFIVFDELFRGTNVRDAFDATVAITAALSGINNCVFIISTHIVEAGQVLGQQYHGIRFLYLPTLIEGLKPKYTYKLQKGITDDRHGMTIINNEGILSILKDGLID